MKICLISIGKTDETEIQKLIEKYEKRLKHYISFNFEVLPDLKNRKSLSIEQQKVAEGKLILEKVSKSDITILLDEKGKQFTSTGFSKELQKLFNSGAKKINFVIGGPFGFSDEVYAFTNRKIALSSMTFSHQMVRVFFIEQIYRAMTIINNEKYHHD